MVYDREQFPGDEDDEEDPGDSDYEPHPWRP
jgi:hypothetical protein